MSNSVSLENIHKIKVFSGLTSNDIKLIAAKIIWHEYKKNTLILNYKEQSQDVYFILEGSVRATTFSISGKEISYQDLEPGDMFGELSAIDSGHRISSIVANSDCHLGKMSQHNFNDILASFPDVNKMVLLRLTGLIRYLCGKIYEFSALDVKDRIRAEIIRYARKNKISDNSAKIQHMPTHEQIAGNISTHREAVTKEFALLTKQGLINKNGRTIIVPDIDKLAGTLLEEI